MGYGDGYFSMSPKSEYLKRGDLVCDTHHRAYLVVMVNQSRARIVPLDPGRDAIDISPGSPLPKITRAHLTEAQIRRLDTMTTTATPTTDSTIDQDTAPASHPEDVRSRLAKLARKPASEATPLGQPTRGKAKSAAKPDAVAKTPKGDRVAKSATTKVAEAAVDGKVAEAAARITKPAAPRPPATVRKCACGCGDETTGFFVPGHDARFKGWLLRIERGEGQPTDYLPKKVADSYEWKPVARIVGDKKVKGLIPTLNYKGQPHVGYLNADGSKR